MAYGLGAEVLVYTYFSKHAHYKVLQRVFFLPLGNTRCRNRMYHFSHEPKNLPRFCCSVNSVCDGLTFSLQGEL